MIHNPTITSSPEETQQLAYKLAASLTGGSIVTLTGSLGSGKTVFARGIARYLGIDEPIVSPTYTIIQEYEGSLRIHHMDLYRIPNLEDFEMLGAEELLYDDQAVSLIEWSGVIDDILPDYTIRVFIEILDNQERSITIEGALL